MNNPIRTIAIAACGLVASGCATTQAWMYDPYKAGEHLNGPRLEWDKEWDGRFPQAGTASTAQRFAYHLIRESDRKCENYLVGSSAARNGAGLGLELIASGLTTGATLASPSGSANLLAAGAGFFTGANRSLDASLFDGQEFGAIYRVVHRGRDIERQALMSQIQNGDFDALPPDGIAAVIDVYDRKCGVNYALTLIEQAVGDADLQPTIPQVAGGDGS